MRLFVYQERVWDWLYKCFGQDIACDQTERSFRFLEEALELVQAAGATKEQALALVDYVYSRDRGEVRQELGGVMVTLAAFAAAAGFDLEVCGQDELNRVSQPEIIDKIRKKQAMKRGVVSHAAQAAIPGEWLG